MNQEYKVILQKDDGIYSTLVVEYICENSSILCSANITIHLITREFNIDPSNISSITLEKEQNRRIINIKYINTDLSSITSILDKNEQILATLNLLGYSSDKVESISFDNPSWFANIYEQYDLDDDSKLDYELSISKRIREILGFYVQVSIV